MVGEVGYYRARADDFVKRHPGEAPPDYYLEYGEENARLFTQEAFAKLSPSGQVWVKETFVRLQQAIEELRERDPAAFDRLERDPAAFRDFAYATHSKAYLDSGVSALSVQELADIASTPAGKHLFSVAALTQAFEVAGSVLDEKLKHVDAALITETMELIRRARANAQQ